MPFEDAAILEAHVVAADLVGQIEPLHFLQVLFRLGELVPHITEQGRVVQGGQHGRRDTPEIGEALVELQDFPVFAHGQNPFGGGTQDGLQGGFAGPQRGLGPLVLLQQLPFAQRMLHRARQAGKGGGRLDHIVQRAGLHHFHHELLVAEGGHHEHREGRVFRRMGEHLQRAPVRQVQIHQGQVRWLGHDADAEGVQARHAFDLDVAPGLVEGTADGLDMGLFVIHDQ